MRKNKIITIGLLVFVVGIFSSCENKRTEYTYQIADYEDNTSTNTQEDVNYIEEEDALPIEDTSPTKKYKIYSSPGKDDPLPEDNWPAIRAFQEQAQSETPPGTFNKYAVDVVALFFNNAKSHMEMKGTLEGFDFSSHIYDKDAVNLGIEFKINADRNYYKQKYAQEGITDGLLDYLYSHYDAWESAKINGTLPQLAVSKPNNRAGVSVIDIFNAAGDNFPTTIAVRQFDGMDIQYRAFAQYRYMDEKGNYHAGRPLDANGVMKFSQVVTDPQTGRPIIQVIGKGLNPTGTILKAQGTSNVGYVHGGGFTKMVYEGAKQFSYTDEDGVKQTLKNVAYAPDGKLVTNNRFLAGFPDYTKRELSEGLEIKNILEKNGVKVTGIYNNKIKVSKDGKIITYDKQSQPTFYNR